MALGQTSFTSPIRSASGPEIFLARRIMSSAWSRPTQRVSRAVPRMKPPCCQGYCRNKATGRPDVAQCSDGPKTAKFVCDLVKDDPNINQAAVDGRTVYRL